MANAGAEVSGGPAVMLPAGKPAMAPRVLLYLSFAASGAGCALPGVLLPWLLVERHWQDWQGGRLFLLIALGSATGPLLVALRARRASSAGCLLVALAAAGWSLHGSPMQLVGIVWGLGLGMTMTGVSLVSQQAASDGPGVLTRLNCLWALGACACPLLASRILTIHTPGFLLRILAVLFSLLCLALLVLVPSTLDRTGGVSTAGTSAWQLSYWDPRGIPLGLLAATALATGIEASGGAWLATYASRSSHLLAFTVAAPSCFWAGLLCSRSLSWFNRTGLHGRLRSRMMLLLVLLAASSFLLPFRSVLLLLGSFALGFGLGPLYPEMLSRVLSFRHTSFVFFLAGVASALMPWATGVLSARAGSLRIGLLVPAAGALVMLLGGWSAMAKEHA